jgi:hypothetical protein
MSESTKCGIIVPRRRDILGEGSDEYLPECIRGRGHRGPHVFLTPEGKYIAWEDDWSCGCCKPEEDDRCYTYGEITEDDFRALQSTSH